MTISRDLYLRERTMEKLIIVLALVVLIVSTIMPMDALAESDQDEWTGFGPEDMYDPIEFTGFLGDWYGQRAKLAENGFTVDIDVTQFYQGVLGGGTDSSWKYGGTAEFNFQFDFQKLGLWPGAFINGRATHQFGRFANGDTGTISSVNTAGMWPVPDYDGVAVPQLVFTQFLSEDFAVFLGKIDASDGDSTRFSGARGKDNFMNSNLVFNPVIMTSAPLSSLGGGVLFIWPDVHAERPATLALTVMGGNGQANTVGWGDDFEDGSAYSAAFKLPTNFFDKDGAHTFMALYNDSDFTILNQDSPFLGGMPPTLEESDGTWGLLYNFDQYLFNEAEDESQGFGLFGRLGVAEGDTNPADTFYSIGLGGKGMIDGRDEDTYGIGYYYIELSDELPRSVRTGFGDSQGVELFYNIEVTKWLHITPDFQIINPSDKSVDTAYVAGFRARMDF